MAIYRCKMCGGDLEVLEDVSVVTCEFCGTGQTIPTVRDENIQALFNRANILRMKSEFDRAAELYEKIIQASEKEAEAYWGLILCKYGIEYVEDPATFKRIPTCHRTSYEAVTADENYKKAIQYADVLQRAIYETEAKAIEEIQKGILAISQKEEPYDVFICYKETDADGKRTVDSAIANEIYHELTQEGFKVFYAAITLEDRLGTEYEPYIFSALNSAKVMILLGTRPEYFNAVWVKNEWSRFLKIMEKDRSRLLVPCYRDMDAYELPEEFAHLQAQDMSKIGFINDVIRGIKKVIAKEETEPAEETAAAQPVFGNSSMRALLDRGYMALEDGEWENANEYFDQVLNMDAKCGDAYLGMLLAESRLSNVESFSAFRLEQYVTVEKKLCEACESEDERIENIINSCIVKKFLEKEAFKGFFDYNLYFESELSCRQNDYDTEQNYMAQNKLINRAVKFLRGEKKEQFDHEIEQVEAELSQRLNKAKREHEETKTSVITSYKKFLAEREAWAIERSNDAKERRREKYEEACKAQAVASMDSEYELAAGKFYAVGEYQDSVEREDECRQAAEHLRALGKRAAARKKLFKCMVAAVICILIVIAAMIVNMIKVNSIRDILIGQTFTGEHYEEHESEESYVFCEYELMVLDENTCRLIMTRTVKTLWREPESDSFSEDCTYKLKGGMDGVKFNCNFLIVSSSNTSFAIEIDGDQITLGTPGFNKGIGIILSN